MDSVQPLQDSVLRHPGYLNFAASRVLSSLGFQSVAVAMGWMIYDQTHSAFMLGVVGFCQFLPMALLTFVVGQVADRFDRRRISLACQLVEAATVLALALATWQHVLNAPGILVAVTILGAAQAFERPTMAALLPNIIPATLLQSSRQRCCRSRSPPRPR
jgi:MFS family permease